MPDTPRRAPTPFECFQAGMFHGLMAERRDVRSYTADEIRDGFAGWLEERAADDPRPGVPEVEADPGERRSLSIGDLFPGPEHRYYDAERIEALREPLSWGVMPSVTVMDLLELVCDWQSLTARLAAGATATPEPGGLVLGAEDRFHLWARLFGIQQEAKSGQFGTPSQHITLDHIYEEVTLALDYFEAGPRPAPAAASPERRSPNIDRLMRAGILADLDAERPGQDNEALADELIAFAKAEGRRIAAASPEPDEGERRCEVCGMWTRTPVGTPCPAASPGDGEQATDEGGGA